MSDIIEVSTKLYGETDPLPNELLFHDGFRWHDVTNHLDLQRGVRVLVRGLRLREGETAEGSEVADDA